MREEELKNNYFYWVKYGNYYSIAKCKQVNFGGRVGSQSRFDLIGSDEIFEFIELEIMQEVDIPDFVDMEKLY